MYDYRKAVLEDATNYIKENYDTEELRERYEEEGTDLLDELQDEMWTADSVTGNASGSYTFNTYKAEENLAHNWETLQMVADAWGIDPTISTDYEHGSEWWDVTIRCYLLSEVVAEALETAIA